MNAGFTKNEKRNIFNSCQPDFVEGWRGDYPRQTQAGSRIIFVLDQDDHCSTNALRCAFITSSAFSGEER